MITLRHAEHRGATDMGWLDSRHTFSFGSYRDSDHMGFATMRVINDDRVAPGGGFQTHGHDNMEIISYVLDGALAHKDSMGNGSTIKTGDVQIMSAGSGVEHSEFNASDTESVHFLQIWIHPKERDITPAYDQKHFSRDDKAGHFKLIGSPDGRDGTIKIHQDVHMYAGLLNDGDHVTFDGHDKKLWVHVARGSVRMNDHDLRPGDGAGVDNESLSFSHGDDTEILIFDFG